MNQRDYSGRPVRLSGRTVGIWLAAPGVTHEAAGI